MEVLSFIDMGIKVENAISGLYESAAAAAAVSAPDLVSELKARAREEIGHANALKMARNYAAAMPDLFSVRSIDVSDIGSGLEESAGAMVSIPSGTCLKPLLEFLLDMEKRFERLHLSASVAIKDDSLKSLFLSLSKGDCDHIASLTKILADLA